MATILAIVAGAIVTGAGFVIGGELVQEGQHLIKEGIQKVETYINKPLSKREPISALHEKMNVEDILLEGKRKILKNIHKNK